MQKRKLGSAGLEVSAIGLGCMGMSQSYGAPLATADAVTLIRDAVRARRHLLRHGRGLRSLHQRGGRRRGAGAVPRPGRDRDQVRLRHRPDARAARHGQPARAHPRGGRGVAEAAQDRTHRSALPAPGRSERADRGRGGHGQGADRARARSSISACPRQACRHIRRAHAVQPVSALQSEYSLWWREPEEAMASSTLRGARHRLRARSARWARASSPARSTQTRRSTSDDFRNTRPPLRARGPQGEPGASWMLLGADRRRQEGDAGADRARLAAGAEALDRPDPRHDQAAPPRGEHRGG